MPSLRGGGIKKLFQILGQQHNCGQSCHGGSLGAQNACAERGIYAAVFQNLINLFLFKTAFGAYENCKGGGVFILEKNCFYDFYGAQVKINFEGGS